MSDWTLKRKRGVGYFLKECYNESKE